MRIDTSRGTIIFQIMVTWKCDFSSWNIRVFFLVGSPFYFPRMMDAKGEHNLQHS